MWGIDLLKDLFAWFNERPRLKIEASIVAQTDRPPFVFERPVLLVTLRNPLKEDLPIDHILISVAGLRWILNQHSSFQGEDGVTPPCTVPARSRCQFWIDAITVAETFLSSDFVGKHTFDVVVSLSTGSSNRSLPVSIDLDDYRDQLAARDASLEKQVAEVIRSTFDASDVLETVSITKDTLVRYLKDRFPKLPVARNDQQLLAVLRHVQQEPSLAYDTIYGVQIALNRTEVRRARLAERHAPRSALDQVIRAFAFENEEYLEAAFPLRGAEFEEVFRSVAAKYVDDDIGDVGS